MGNISYRFRLNPSENWQYTTQNSLLLSNLPSGEYHLEIYASNDGRNWSSKPAYFLINVAFPFWRTWLFIASAILVGLLLIYGLYRLSINRIKNAEKIKRQIQNLRFEALSAQMNPHFMFNSLNSIQHFIIDNDRKASVRYLSKFAKLMRKTLDHSRQQNVFIKEELEALNLYLELESLRFDRLIKYSVLIDPSIDDEKGILPALLIQPIVENAILHGLRPRENGGTIRIIFERVENQLTIEIVDDGVGRLFHLSRSKYKHKLSGMDLTRERIELFAKDHGGYSKFDVIDLYEDEMGSGTKIKIDLPYILL